MQAYDGGPCPYCFDGHLEYGDSDDDGEIRWEQYYCRQCNQTIENRYSISYEGTYDEDGNDIDPEDTDLKICDRCSQHAMNCGCEHADHCHFPDEKCTCYDSETEEDQQGEDRQDKCTNCEEYYQPANHNYVCPHCGHSYFDQIN